MVAVFTGLGAGFERGSAAALGSGGLLGAAGQGRSGEGAFLNAYSGNLIISRQDEFLIGRGPDAGITRTYNSLGALDDNGDYWRQSTDRRVYGLTGSYNTANSTINRVSADGSEITYTWSAAASAYVTTAGSGAHDKLTWDGSKWTWNDGDTSIREVYALASTGVWRIESQFDGDNNELKFAYDGSGHLTTITTQKNGATDVGYIEYGWTGNNLTSVKTYYDDLATGPTTLLNYTLVTYGYDTSNRLTTVTVDLTPNNTADSVTYVTTYTYSGTSNRITKIQQTDGSVLDIAYDASFRVTSLTQTAASGDMRVTSVTYTDEGNGLWRTEVTDPRGQVTKIWSKLTDTGGTTTDERAQLVRVMAPPAATGGTPTDINYTYDGDGNVLTAVTKSGATVLSTVTYAYDANGNVTQVTDANSNVVTRSYDANNHLTLETRTGTYAGGSGSLYTRYVYDAEEHLAYTISAEGEVTEYRYTTPGELEYVVQYPAHTYTIGSTIPTLANMTAWRDGLTDRSTAMIVKNVYDVRGNLVTSTRYGSANSSGVEQTGEGTSTTTFVYDQSGRLLSRYDSAGSSTVQEVYAYDGLGRMTVSTDGLGNRSTIAFADAATTTTVTTQTTSGSAETGQSYIVVSTYNKAGDLISVADSGSATGSSFTNGGTATSIYDKNGRVRLTTDATGLRHFYLYDKAGQKVADITADTVANTAAVGEIVEYRYDALGRVIGTAHYANTLTTAQLTTLSDPTSEVDIASIRPAAHSYDIWQWSVYDAGGRVIKTILGDGSVTDYEYDASDRLVKTTGYYNKIAAGTLSGYMGTTPASWPTSASSPGTNVNDVVMRTFYDRAGRVIGTLNGEGYLTEILYDEAGEKVREIAYANATVAGNRASGSFDLLKASLADAARDISVRYVYDGQGLLRFTIDALNHVTENIYYGTAVGNATGLLRRTVTYAAPLATPPANYNYATVKTSVAALAAPQNDKQAWSIYNTRGQLIYVVSQIRADLVSTVWHPIGTVIRYDYDLAGNVIKTTQYASTIDMDGRSVDAVTEYDTWASTNGTNARITRNYYAERGELRFTVNAEGYVTRNDYDAEGRLIYVYRFAAPMTTASDTTLIGDVDVFNKGSSVSDRYGYDYAGRLVQTWDANGVRDYFGYYATGKQAWNIRSHAQAGTDDDARVLSVYNQAGRLVRQVDYTSDAGFATALGTNATLISQAQRIQSANTQYSAVVTREGELRIYYKGEAIWSNGVAESNTAATYRLVAQSDGNLVMYRDVSGQSSVAIWSTATSYAGATYLKMQDNGNLELRKGTAGADLGLLWSSGTTGVTGSTYATEWVDANYTYDGLGNLATAVDGKGQTTSYVYDKAGRMVQETRTDGLKVDYDYDAFGHGVRISGVHANAVTPDRYSYSYYDQLGRIVLSVDNESYAVRTTYNAFGEIDTVTRYYNKATGTGSLTTQPLTTTNAKDAVTTFAYDRLGRLTSTTNAEGAVESYTYNAFNQKLTVTNALGGVTTYAYNARGLVSSETLPVGAYNAAGTLVTANVVNTYAYDSRGNRTQMVEASGLSEARTTTYTYDAADRLTTVSHDTVSVTTSAGTTSNIAPQEQTIYDRRDNVIEKVDATGARTLYWYDDLDRVTHQLSATGTLTRFFYDKNSNVMETWVYETAVTLPANALNLAPTATGAYRVTRYAYDALDRLIETRIPAIDVGSIVSGALTITNTDLVTTTVYDNAGNVVKVIDAAGKASWFYYDKAGNRTVAVDAENGRTDWTYDAGGNVLTETRYANATTTAPTSTTTPPAVTADAARDRVTTYVYDKAGRRTHVVDARNYAVVTAYNGLGEAVTVTRYAVPVTWSAGAPVTTANAADAVTRLFYDALGRLLQTADATNSTVAPSFVASQAFWLDGLGERVREKNELGGVTTYAYDKLGRMTSETLPVGAYNAAGTQLVTNVVNTYAYDATGNRTRMVEASNVVDASVSQARTTNYEYNAVGQLTRTYGVSTAVYASSTAASSTSVTPETRSIYNLYGEVIETVDAGGGRTLFWYNKAGELTHQLSASGTLTQFFYDANGNTIETRVYATQISLPANANGAAPTGTGAYRVTRHAYDGLNRATEVRIPSIDTAVYASGTLTVGTNDLITTTVYDAQGNVVKTIDPNGKATWFYYDKTGHQTVKIDAENYRTDMTYDADGNVLTETRYATAGTTTAGTAPTSTTSPPAAPTATVDDRITTFTYDKLGRRLTEARSAVLVFNGTTGTNSQTSTITYTYNGLGQVATKTEGTGEAVTYTYDAAGRLVTEARASFTDVNGNTVTPTVEYAYNGLNDLARTRQVGAGGTIAAADRITTYAYGTGGRLATMTDPSGFTHTYRYDAAGRVVREEYTRVVVSGTTATEAIGTDYDIEGRATTTGIMTWTGSVWTRYSLDYVSTQYDAFGAVSARGLNGVMAETFSYDGAGRLWRTTSGDGTTKYFMYDKAGNQTLAITSDGMDISNQTVTWALDRWGATRSAIATTFVDGVNATLTRYDGRNMAVEVLEPQRETSQDRTTLVTTKDNLQTQRGYNAFGEVKYEINALGAQIDYTYNTMGRQIKIESPTVAVTSEAGAVTSVRPTENRYYDLSGRLVANKDANGNITKLTLLAGAGYGGSEAQATVVTAADGGITRTKYDIFGDARRIESPLYNVTTAPQYVTLQSFDAMGRLIQMTRPGGLIEYYAYDGLGQRLATANSFYNNSTANPTFNAASDASWLIAERTTYDGQGRVTLQVAAGGDTTSYAYAWSSSLVTTGLGTFGGWTRTATLANGKTQITSTDQFQHDVSSTDMGGWVTTYTFDKAGRIALKSGSTAYGPVPLEIYYYNTGRVSKTGTSGDFDEPGMGTYDHNKLYTWFTYDKAGDLKTEFQDYDHQWSAYVTVSGGESGGGIVLEQYSVYMILKDASANYDALGRITSWTENAGIAGAATRAFEYDANGNIRRSNAVFHQLDSQGNIATGTTAQDYWYRYDAMNRMVTSMGALSGGAISRGTTGVDMTYDAAGRRLYQLSGSGTVTREDYTYDAEGRITQVNSGTNPSAAGGKRSDFTYDALGRQTLQRDYDSNGTTVLYSRSAVYNNKNQVTSDSSSTLRSGITYTADSTYYYTDASSLYYLGSTTKVVTINKENGVTKKTNQTENLYIWAEGALQDQIKYTADLYGAPTAVNTTTFNYRVIGGQHQLVGVGIEDGRPRSVYFYNDISGQAVRRDERDTNTGAGDPHQLWYRFGGKQMGYVSNDGSMDTSYIVSIANRTAASAGTGAFANGATTGTSFADFDVATDQVNSFYQGSQTGGYTVQQGDTLQSIAANLWGDTSLWYKLAEVNGLSSSSTLTEGTMLIIPAGVIRNTNSASTFKPYDPGEILGNVNPTTAVTPKPKKNKCGVLGQILMVVIAVAVTVWTAGALSGATSGLAQIIGSNAIATGAVAGAAGSVASQAFGVATGIQNKFSWNAVGMAALGGGIGGAGNLGVGGSDWGSVAARAMVGSAVSQGIGVITGMQKNFSWVGVVAAGIGSAVSSQFDAKALSVQFNGGRVGDMFARGLTGGASAIANAAARTLIEGTDFGDNLLAALPDVIGGMIGQAIGDFMLAPKTADEAVERQIARGERRAAELRDEQQSALAKGDTKRAEALGKEIEMVTDRALNVANGVSEFAVSKYGNNASKKTMAEVVGSDSKYVKFESDDASGLKKASSPTVAASASVNGSDTVTVTGIRPALITDDSGRLVVRSESAIGRVVVNATVYAKEAVELIPEGIFRDAAVAGVKFAVTGGIAPVVEFGVNQGIDAAIPILPTSFLEPLAKMSGDINDFVGGEGGSFLLDKKVDDVDTRDRKGVSWATTTLLGVAAAAVAGKIAQTLLRRSCFAASTLVHAERGLISIEHLKVGDRVWSRSEHDVGQSEWRMIVEHACTGEREIYEVTVSTATGRAETYRTTELHPFWTETGGDEGRGGFIVAGDLRIGEQLRLADGSAAYVTNVTATGVVEPVYNFSVEGWHTYHVGELGVWVHNECLDALLRNYRPTQFDMDGAKFIVRPNDLKHILSRHHPKYFDPKDHGDFFPEDFTVDDINAIIGKAMRQQKAEGLIRVPKEGLQIVTTYKDMPYTVGLRQVGTNGFGTIGQLSPGLPR